MVNRASVATISLRVHIWVKLRLLSDSESLKAYKSNEGTSGSAAARFVPPVKRHRRIQYHAPLCVLLLCCCLEAGTAAHRSGLDPRGNIYGFPWGVYSRSPRVQNHGSRAPERSHLSPRGARFQLARQPRELRVAARPSGTEHAGQGERASPPRQRSPCLAKRNPRSRRPLQAHSLGLGGRRCLTSTGVSASPPAIVLVSGTSVARPRPPPQPLRCRAASRPDGPSKRASASAAYVGPSRDRSSFFTPEAP
ncbi:hypothetical protein NDU88_007316 [Pleurodeles waltl]|uniref:Uncharacterized protein n=1 Tax=Pleurodeles waltl TaxID=8319 RepID=A0AAV7U0S6_PLEWA|nr:hypothetical protein NDU88_007316 [Pleurodeles waltl]